MDGGQAQGLHPGAIAAVAAVAGALATGRSPWIARALEVISHTDADSSSLAIPQSRRSRKANEANEEYWSAQMSHAQPAPAYVFQEAKSPRIR